MVSTGGWWLVVVGVEEVQDRLLEEVCFFFGCLHGYFVGWLVERGRWLLLRTLRRWSSSCWSEVD